MLGKVQEEACYSTYFFRYSSDWDTTNDLYTSNHTIPQYHIDCYGIHNKEYNNKKHQFQAGQEHRSLQFSGQENKALQF